MFLKFLFNWSALHLEVIDLGCYTKRVTAEGKWRDVSLTEAVFYRDVSSLRRRREAQEICASKNISQHMHTV